MKEEENKLETRLEKYKAEFDESMTIIEQCVAESLSSKLTSEKFKKDLQEIKSYIDQTEKSLDEIKGLIK